MSLTVGPGTPTANSQSVSTGFNTATAVTLTGTDPDSPALPLTYTVAAGPTHGTLSGGGADLTYTPTAGYHGADSFTFTDSNGANTSAAATVSLTVGPGTPTANSQSVSVGFDRATAVTLTGGDPDSPALPLTYAIASAPTHGTLSGLNASTGAVTYTPSAGYHGPDSFTFTDGNGSLTSSVATVALNVAADVAPTIAGTAASSTSDRTEDTLFSNVVVTDPDQPAQVETATISFAHGAGALTGAGAVTTANGVDTYTLQAASASALSTALQAVAFQPTATAVGPNTQTTVSLIVTDAANAASPTDANTVVTVAHGTDTPPTIGSVSDMVAAPPAGSVVLAGSLTVRDSDAGASALSAQVAFASGFTAGDVLSVTPAAGIAASYDTASGVLRLTGGASDLAYQQTLESVAFSHPGAVAAGTRTVTFSVVDDQGMASNTPAETVNVSAYARRSRPHPHRRPRSRRATRRRSTT